MAGGKDLEIVMLPEVQEQMDADPELAEAMRDMMAAFHQANDAVQRGQYATMEDAMEAITGHRPEPVDMDQVSMNEALGLDDGDDD